MNDNLSFGNYPNKFEQFSARGETFLFEAPMDSVLILDSTPQKLQMADTVQPMAHPLKAAFSAAAMKAVVNAAGNVTPENGVNYCLRNAKSGLYLTVDNASAADGVNCSQRAFTGEENQVWFLHKAAGSNYFQLVPRHARTKQLTVLNGSSTSGSNVGIAARETKPLSSQEWSITATSRNSIWSTIRAFSCIIPAIPAMQFSSSSTLFPSSLPAFCMQNLACGVGLQEAS